MKELGKALTAILVQFLSDWKMPFFRGILYAAAPALAAIYSGLQDYHSMADLDELTWLKIKLNASISAISGIVGFLDGSFQKTRDKIKERDNGTTGTQAATAITETKV